MTLQEAITKAVERGWKSTIEPYRSFSEAVALAVLDPLFWQSLGKSMGWCMNDVCYANLGNVPLGYIAEEELEWGGCAICVQDGVYKSKSWKSYWHRLIDHLAEGKSIETYFETL